mmetsp:Transcript_106665/g.206665  ORF Transcript_106665/g.206665 Transcript_106665/m.206665 type:complete len:221 (-) Transcript_106665:107-769(-)
MGGCGSAAVASVCCRCNEPTGHPDKNDTAELTLVQMEKRDVSKVHPTAAPLSPGEKILAPAAVGVPPLPCDFIVSVDRVAGCRLGIDIIEVPGRGLLVHSVTGGLVSDWNETHPMRAVKVGSCILEANSVRGDVPRMLAECQHEGVLDLIVRPPPHERGLDPAVHGSLCACRTALTGLLDGVPLLSRLRCGANGAPLPKLRCGSFGIAPVAAPMAAAPAA